MKNIWQSIFHRGTAEGDVISGSALNVTKFVSILLLIFAVIAQVLAWIRVIKLSTTQQVTIWLVVAGLIVVLAIADMACRAYASANKYDVSAAWPRDDHTSQPGEGLADEPAPGSAAVQPDEPPSQGSKPVATPPSPPAEPRPLRSVPSEDVNPGDGERLDVSMADVFPHGAYLVQGSISDAQDCDESVETRPVVDKGTGKQVFQVQVVDVEEGQPRPMMVKVVADRMPDLPPPANGSPFTPIEFEGLTVAEPPKINRGRAEYTALRATGIRPITPAPAHDPEQKAG
jgi:hypothetical protein